MGQETGTKTSRGRGVSQKGTRTYASALKYLFSATDYERMLRVRYNTDTFNLFRMRALLRKLGNPHTKIRTVHIAGTKGKGSTAAMLAEMLKSCGYKVGLYTSPHICDIRERIAVNGQMIPRTALAELINLAEPHIEKMGDDKPTFFEILTALAFRYFAAEQVDFAVVEAGLGGRLDSTNVLKPLVCGLTSISIDHTYQLGKTLEEITAEKAGIFKPDVPVVSVPQSPAAARVLKKAATESGIELAFTGEDIEFSCRVESSRQAGCHARVCLTTSRSKFEHLPVPLLGEHQAVNCGLALALLDRLKAGGVEVDDEKAVKGLAGMYLPGRMEMIRQDPRILVDGAHNAASMQALIRALGQHIPYDSMVMIFGCAADKDINGMMDQIATGADKVVFTRANDSPRAAEPEELAEIYEQRCERTSQVTDNLVEAIRTAEGAVTREDIICITGSFYLVGQAKQLLQ